MPSTAHIQHIMKDLLRWRRRFRSSHRCRSLSGGWRWRRHGGGVSWRWESGCSSMLAGDFQSLLHFTFILHCKMYIVHYIRMVVELVLMAIVMTTTARPRGTVIREIVVPCKFFCFHRAVCKIQVCCPW